jgi:hypothetical protein
MMRTVHACTGESDGNRGKEVLLWSLGTGSYVPEEENRRRLADSNLFWSVSKGAQLVLDGQKNDLCKSLRAKLGTNFVRWQVQLQQCIPMDSYDPDTLAAMEDAAYARMDELEAWESPYSLTNIVRGLEIFE